MYLVDTNVWLERLLDQEKSNEVGYFFNEISSDLICITDFTFHTIGIILNKLNQIDTLSKFVKDAFYDNSVNLLHLNPDDTNLIVHAVKEFKLDFDDAYQYAAAEKYTLTLVSFDTDFDKTKLGKKTPSEICKTQRK